MSDTPTQAAALPPLPKPPLRFVVGLSPTGRPLDYSAEDMRAYARRAIAQQAQELDALRAALRWNDVRTDGPPPCDGEAVFDGINSAGYPAAFNAYDASDGDCYMETAESNAHVMGDLRYWRRHVGPTTEGEANV